MTKHFAMFMSLFAAVALFLGLMVTGCSEGDNTIAGFNNSSHTLIVTVGYENDTATNGNDCPKPEKIVLGVVKADGSLDEIEFAENKKGTVQAWNHKDNNRLEMVRDLDKSLAQATPSGSIVLKVYGAQDAILGAYVGKGLDFTKPIIPKDFTDITKEANRFFKASEFIKTPTVLGFEDNLVKVQKDATTEIKVAIETQVEGISLFPKENVTDFELKSDSPNIAVNSAAHTVTGKVVSATNNLDIIGSDFETTVNVEVVAGPTKDYPVSLAIKDSIEQPDFDANDKVTITYSVNGTAQKPVEVTTEEDYNFHTGAAGEAVKIESVAWYSTSTELTRRATAFDPTDATVNISAKEDNTITVTAWEERPGKHPVSLAIKDSIEQPDFNANDKVTITYSVNGTAQEPVIVTTEADYNFYTGAAGEAVKIESVAWYSTSTELTRRATAFDPTNATVNISATEDNTITVTAWAERPDLGVTLKIAEGVEMPDFGEGDRITIHYRVDSGEVQSSIFNCLPYEFYTAKAGQMIGIDSVSWYSSETTMIKFAELDPEVLRIMVGSDNAFTITGWQ